MNRSDIVVCAVVYLAIGGASVMGAKWYVNISAPVPQSACDTSGSEDDLSAMESFDVPGVHRPRMTRAAAATIGDSAVVIGVVVAGEARAYSIDAMRMPPEAIGEDAPDIDYFMKRHVVNDLIGGVPVSITYCDLTRQVRVLTDASQNRPLPLRIAGQRDGQMVLLLQGSRFLQSDEAIALDDLAFDVTTWTLWKQHHPHTTIYAGDLQSN